MYLGRQSCGPGSTRVERVSARSYFGVVVLVLLKVGGVDQCFCVELVDGYLRLWVSLLRWYQARVGTIGVGG
jgi:hypothetical protein